MEQGVNSLGAWFRNIGEAAMQCIDTSLPISEALHFSRCLCKYWGVVNTFEQCKFGHGCCDAFITVATFLLLVGATKHNLYQTIFTQTVHLRHFKSPWGEAADKDNLNVKLTVSLRIFSHIVNIWRGKQASYFEKHLYVRHECCVSLCFLPSFLHFVTTTDMPAAAPILRYCLSLLSGNEICVRCSTIGTDEPNCGVETVSTCVLIVSTTKSRI